MNEGEIIRGCIDEDRRAQEALYNKYSSRMLGVCLRYAADRMEAEDMLQEGFVKVFDNISSFSSSGSFEGWIYKIMVRTALNKIRARHKEISFVEEFTVDPKFDPGTISKINQKQLMEAVNSMPEGYRIVFNLFAVEGYSHQEIADELNISHSTSRSQYAKAKKYMQKLIEKLEKVNL